MLTYNKKDVLSATGQTPYKARDKDNEFKSRSNIAMKAKKQSVKTPAVKPCIIYVIVLLCSVGSKGSSA